MTEPSDLSEPRCDDLTAKTDLNNNHNKSWVPWDLRGIVSQG